jgi:sugar phosphate isomerase/epimerase
VVELVASKGYEAVEIPAYTDNGQMDVDEMLKPGNAKKLKKQINDAGLAVSGISNHADSPLVLGPHGKDLASICPGSAEDQIRFGTESMLKCARLAW